MTLLITVNTKHNCNVTFINVISKVIIGEVFISIVIVSLYYSVLSQWIDRVFSLSLIVSTLI